MKSKFENKMVMIITAVACCIAWGSAFPSIKLSYKLLEITNEYQMLLFAGLRFALAGAGVLVFARLKMKKGIALKKKELPFTILISFLQTFGAYLLFYIGLSNTTAVKSSILVSTSVFVVAVLAHFMFKTDRMNIKKGFGLLLGFLGVLLVNISLINGSVFTFSFGGEGLLFIHVIMGSLTVVLIRKRHGFMDIIKLNGWQLFLGGLGLIIVGYIGYPHMPPFNFTSSALLVYLAALSGIAFTLWFTLLKHHNASLIEQYKFLVPVSGTILSVLVLPGEHIGVEIFFAVLFVSAGTIIVNRQDSRIQPRQ